MDNIADNPDAYREEGTPDIPLTFAIAAARQSRDPEPDSSWEAAQKMKWLPITTMPLSLFSLRFPNARRTARQCQHDFRGINLTAVTSMKGVSEIKDSKHKNLVVRRPMAKLRYTMQLQEEANRECGTSLPLDGIRHMEITYELPRLRATLNVHKLDVDNQRRGITEADMWLRLAEGLLPAYDQPQPSEAATDLPAATPADVMALAGVRAWAEYEANKDADDAIICPPTRTLLALLEVREWLTDTMTAAGIEMYLHHTEPTLLRVGDDNLSAISLGKEDEDFADTLRLAVALTSHVALLRAIRLRTIVIYLTKSEFDPSELLIHPFSQTIREAGELGSNTGHNQIRRAAIGMRKKARKTAPASLALRATGRPIYTLSQQLIAHQHSIIGGTRSTDRTDQWRKTVSTTPNPTATSSDPSNPNLAPAHADDEEELELNSEEDDSAMEVDTTHGEATETPGPADISLDFPPR
eukprot:jgi/Tetstr1/444666/TSEL_032514.t1